MVIHYVRRFFSSLSSRPPDPDDEAWARALVTEAQWVLVARLSNQDRRHLVANAREVDSALGPEADPTWVQAALLHDVGKFDAKLGTIGRSLATVTAVVVGRRRIAGWATRDGWRGRYGRYERHGEIGAAQIRAVGGPEAAAEWSALHHHRDQFAKSTIPPAVLAVLDAADWD